MLAATTIRYFCVLIIQKNFFLNFIFWIIERDDFYSNFNEVSNSLLLSGVKREHGDVFGGYVAFSDIFMTFSDIVGGIFGVALRVGGHGYG